MWLLPEDQVDLSELEGRKFTCIDGCGLCCLCQPELLPNEEKLFRSKFPDMVVLKNEPHRHYAMAMKKGMGSCAFLNDRRCKVYNERPHFCQEFPFHIHVGIRAQVQLDLSCRGAWVSDGEDARAVGAKMAEDARAAILHTLYDSKRVYREFFDNCHDNGIDPDPEPIQALVRERIVKMTYLPYLAAVLEGSAEDEEQIDLKKLRVPNELDKSAMKELESAALEGANESLGAPNAFDAPVYCDEANRWNVFLSEHGRFEQYVIKDSGDLDHIRTVDPNAVRLLVPDESGRKVLADYIRVLNNRDSIVGSAYYLVDEYEYEDYFPNVYTGVLSTSILDLLWRASLIAHVKGTKLDAVGVREGIIYYDMDRLDGPSIGAFI